VFADGGIYHVYARTARRERVFADPNEAQRFLNLVREIKRQDGFAVLAWCVMPTHYHLVLRTGEVSLSRTMRLIQGRFAQGYNRRHRSLGSLWQERYKTKLIRETAYVRTAIGYVHLNPVAAGMAEKADAYPMSGHGALIGQREDGLLDADEALALFGSGRREACGAYRRVLAALAKIDKARLGADKRWEVAEGAIEVDPGRVRLDALDATVGGVERPALSPAEFLMRACRVLGVETITLGSPRRDRVTVRLRDLVALVGVERYRIPTRALAEGLGQSPDHVSRWVGRAGRRKADDDEFRDEIARLDAAVAVAIAPSPRFSRRTRKVR
jgi:REP element-mobilizing transposase RayT